MDNLLREIGQCTICRDVLPLGPRPVVQAGAGAKILIIGQAPGIKVHQTGIPWDDRSGKELRRWLGVSTEQFYNPCIFALMPMGFCYPGKGKGGDMPPRKECAPCWHQKLLNGMPQIKITFLIGQYAQKYYLHTGLKANLTETVKNYHAYLPQYIPLVHPSPRNGIWQRANPWFEANLVPEIQNLVDGVLHATT